MALTLQHKAKGFYLRPFQLDDAQILYEFRVRNRASHQPFEPKRDPSFFTLEMQEELIRQRRDDADHDLAYMFGVFDALDDRLLGHITLSNISRGFGQYADVGYSMDHEEQGRGIMTAALQLVLQYAFRSLKLHRIQAIILPTNHRSRRVLEKAGFRSEGICRQILKINDQWTDQERYAIIEGDIPEYSK
ncbi:GNAT family protein [Paenibacillus sp. JX-17]|uniref:GNAT family protein n=1 Tax=Paenibacillus lacisoli TaxID=3064525 RepID=A0ABT9CHE7_9BACL|nr:GNAT family protein [Paenibacillus sp. JX-17]MDO7908692.1 GNAT family protein [Paenibacillus sp. JX-17]